MFCFKLEYFYLLEELFLMYLFKLPHLALCAYRNKKEKEVKVVKGTLKILHFHRSTLLNDILIQSCQYSWFPLSLTHNIIT